MAFYLLHNYMDFIFFLKGNFYIALYLMIGQLGLMWLTSLLYKRKQLKLLGMAIIIFLIVFACGSGINYAYLQEKHIVFEVNEKSYVVLTVYKNQFLYAPFDKDTNEVENKYNLDDIKEVKDFSKKRIGRIRVEDNYFSSFKWSLQ